MSLGSAEPDMGPWVGSHSRDGKQHILDERMINEVRLPTLWKNFERKTADCSRLWRPGNIICRERHCRNNLLNILSIF